MIFLCIGYYDATKMDARPESEIEAIMDECQPHLEKFYNSGQVMLDAGMDKDTKCLHRKNGEVRVTDGNMAADKQKIGSAFLIEAQDMEEALEIASLHPTAQVSKGEEFGWSIEIRPVHYFKTKEDIKKEVHQ